MKRRLKKAPASEGGRYKGVRAARDGEGGGCAKIHGLCKQELLDCRRSEKPRSFAFSQKPTLTPRAGKPRTSAWPKCRSRACWNWPSSTTRRKSPMPRCNMWICRGCRKNRMRESLATLRDVDAIAHVIRVFDDPSVPHSEGGIDPLRDATNLDLELILSDHDQISKRLERVEKDLKKRKTRCSSWRKTFWKSARRTWKQRNRCASWN